MAKIQGKSKVINISAITHAGGVSWGITHFLPVYDPSFDLSIKEEPEIQSPYRALPLENLASFEGYCRFNSDGSIDKETISGMDRDLNTIKGQKLFKLSPNSGLHYHLERHAFPFARHSRDSDNILIDVDQLKPSHYNSIRNAQSIVAMPPVCPEQDRFFLGSSNSYNFDKNARLITMNDGSSFATQLASDLYDFDDAFFDWDDVLYTSCNYHAEKDPLNPLTAQGTISCRLQVPEGGELAFNKFLFFITGRDGEGRKVGYPPMLFAECCFNRKYILASNSSQLDMDSTAVLNAFECVVSLKYDIANNTPLGGVTLNENQWVSNASLYENLPEKMRVWKHGNDLDFSKELTENQVDDNSLLQDTYSHTFNQAYSGDVGAGTMYPKARLHVAAKTASKFSDGAILYPGIFPHLKFTDKGADIGYDIFYSDTFLGENANKDKDVLAGMLQIKPSDRIIQNGIAMFKNSYALGIRGAMAFGESSRAIGESAIAFGYKAESLHDFNLAFGWESRALAYLGGVFGHKSYAGELTRMPRVPGFSKSASYAMGHYAKSDSGLAVGVNVEARGFWYSQENLDDEEVIDESADASDAGSAKEHGHTCDCPVCREAVGYLMLASEYDCIDDNEARLGEVILRQFGKLFSYAIGKNSLSAAMSGAMGIDVMVNAYSSLGIGRNIILNNYYSTVIGSDIELKGSSQANMVFAKWMKMEASPDNGGNTIIGQQLEISNIKNSLIFAYGLNLQMRGTLDSVIINSVRSSYTDIPYGFNWNSPRFIDISILSNTTLAAQSATAYWEGINVGVRNKVSTRSISVGVNNAEVGGANVMVGRDIYGVNLIAVGKNIIMDEGNAFGHRLYDVSPFGNFQYGTLIGNDLYNIGGTVIGQFSKSLGNYYYNSDLSPKYGFKPVLTVAGGDGERHWHAFELGKSSFKKAVLNSGSHVHNNFGTGNDAMALWNLIPTETAFPTVADMLAGNANGEQLRNLIKGSSGGFLVADNFSGFLRLTSKSYGLQAGTPGGANALTFSSMVGLTLGGAWHSDNFGPIPFAGVSKYKGYGVNATVANQGEASISAILARFFKNMYGYTNTDDGQCALYWMHKCIQSPMYGYSPWWENVPL